MKIKLKITSLSRTVFTVIRQLHVGSSAPLLMAVFLFAFSSASQAQADKILVIGDSLSAAYGLAVDDGWVAKLEHKIDGTRHSLEVINASVSGDTSANGLSKLPALLDEYDPAFVILELGGNDGLRGLSIKKLRQNLIEMTELAQSKDATVIILGMQIPSNYGAAYTRLFIKTFIDAAEQTDAALVPFFLEGLGAGLEWFQSDGIHPNAKAQEIMLDNVWQVLAPILESQPVN